MNNVHAHFILNQLQQHANWTDRLQPQIPRLFIPSPFDENTVYLRCSWKGRLAAWLQHPWEHTESEQKTHRLFAKALAATSSLERASLGPLGLRFAELYQHYLVNKLIIPENTLLPSFQVPAEVQETSLLRPSIEEEVETSGSLLCPLQEGQTATVLIKDFNALFNLEEQSNLIISLEYISCFLEKHREHIKPDFNHKIDLLKNALKKDCCFIEDLKPLSKKSRLSKLRDISDQLASEVHALNSEKPKTLFLFSYGNVHHSFDALFAKLKLLPKNSLKDLPRAVRKYIDEEQMPDPKQLANALTDICLKTIQDVFFKSKWKIDIDQVLSGFFFSDSNRTIPRPMATLFPDIFEQYLKNTLQDGAIKTVGHFFTDPAIKSTCRWVAENGLELLNEEGIRTELLKKLETTVKTCIVDYVDAIFSFYQKEAVEKWKKIQEFLPPETIEMAGLDDYFFSGPLWIEFEKEEDSFNLAIYSLGRSLNLHPRNYKSEKPYGVLRLKEVTQEKLDSAFFYALLIRHFEPIFDPKISSRAKDIYLGPLSALEGKPAENIIEDHEISHPFPATNWEMLQPYLLMQKPMMASMLFEFYLETFIEFCKPFLHGPEKYMVITGQPTADALEQAMKKIETLMEPFRSEAGMKQKIANVETTFKEVRNAIYYYIQKKESGGFSWKLPSWLSKRSIATARDLVVWAMGDEIGDFFDYVVSYYADFIPEVPVEGLQKKFEVVSKHHKGVARSYIRLYLQMARKAASLILAIMGLYYGGFWYLLNIPFLLSIFPKLLPPPIQVWYSRFMNRAKFCLAQLIIHFIWKYALRQHTKQNLSRLWSQWQQKVKALHKTLKEGRRLSFTLEKPIDPQPAVANRTPPLIPKIHFIRSIPDQKTASIPFPEACPCRKTLHLNSTAELKSVLKNMLKESLSMFSRTKIVYLTNQILRLETPLRRAPSLWDKVDHPLEYMEILSDIGLELMSVKSMMDKSNDREPFAYGNENLIFLVAMHHIQTLLYCLARKCPETSLEGFKINAISLFALYQSKGMTIDDPRLIEKIQEICAYLMPDLDLDIQLIHKDLQTYTENTLFYYPDPQNLTMLLETKPLQKVIGAAEWSYLQKMLENPTVHANFVELGLPFSTLSKEHKLRLLFQESFILGRDKPLLQRPYQLLKLHTLLCQGIHVEWFKTKHRHFCNPKQQPPPLYSDYLTHNAILKSFNKFVRSFGDSLSPCTEWTMPACHSLFYPNLCRTESEIAAHPASTFLDREDYEHAEWLELAGREPSERLLLFINYLKKHKHAIRQSLWPLLNPLFFAPGMLKNQIIKSPQSIQALGELFTELTSYYQKRENYRDLTWTLDLGIRVKRYCEYYTSESIGSFPDFKLILNRLRQDYSNECTVSQRGHFQILYACSLGSPDDRSAARHEEEALTAFQNVWFDPCLTVQRSQISDHSIDPNLVEKNSEPSILRDLLQPAVQFLEKRSWLKVHKNGNSEPPIYERPKKNSAVEKNIREYLDDSIHFLKLFSEWVRLIEIRLQDPLQKNNLLDNLLNQRGIETGATEGAWEECSLMSFRKGDTTIDFLHGDISSSALTDPLNLIRSSSYTAEILGWEAAASLKKCVPGHYMTADRRFKVTANLDATQTYYEVRFFQTWNTQPYQLMETSNSHSPTLLGLDHPSSYFYWMEDNGDTSSQVIIQNKHVPNDIRAIPYPQEQKNSALGLVKIDQKQLVDTLSPLTRFCPLEQLSAYALPGHQQLACLHLKKQNLYFDMHQNADGEVVAKSREFPGFYLSKEQNHQALKGIASYLLLETQSDKKKVLVAQQQCITAFLSRFLSLLGPLEPILMDALAKMGRFNSFEYVACEINPDGKDVLQSEDPSTLAYLLTLHLFQGNKKGSKHQFKKLLSLCHSQKISQSIWKELFLMACIPPFEWEGISHMRCLLFSALEQNRVRFPNPIPSSEPVGWHNLIFAGIILWDLYDLIHHPNRNPSMTRTTELFLYQCAFHHIELVLKHHLKLPNPLMNLVNAVGWDTIIKTFCLASSLSLRYRQLKKDSGLKETSRAKILQFLVKFINAPSGIPWCAQGQLSQYMINAYGEERIQESLLRAFICIRDTYYFNLKAVNLWDLHASMVEWIEPFPVIDPYQIGPRELKRDFAAYYSLARGDYPFIQAEIPEKQLPTSSELKRVLKLHRGGWDDQTRVLFDCLAAVINCPKEFPTTEELLRSHMTIDKRADVQNLEEYYPEWKKFFAAFNHQLLRMYVSDHFIDPLYRRFVLVSNIDPVLNRHIKKLAPPQLFLLPGLKQSTHLLTQAATLVAKNQLIRIAKNFIQLLPGARETLGNLTNKKIKLWEFSKLAGKYFLIFGGFAAIDSILHMAMAELNLLTCQATESIWPAKICLSADSQSMMLDLYSVIIAGAINYLLSKKFNYSFGLYQILPYPLIGVPAVQAAGKLYHALTAKNADRFNKADLSMVRSVADCSLLNIDDAWIDIYLNSLFTLAFKEEKQSTEHEKQIQPITFRLTDPAVLKDRIDRVNRSVQAFYQQHGKHFTSISLINSDALTDIFVQLLILQSTLSKQIKLRKERLLAGFNSVQPTVAKYQLRLVDLYSFIENNTLGAYGQIHKMTDAVLPKIESELSSIDLATSRLQQIKRLTALLNQLINPISSQDYYETLERFADEMKIKTGFNLQKTPSRLRRLNLRYQKKTGYMLWKRQAANREKALYHYTGDLTTEEAPAEGKTDYGIPLTAAHEANGQSIVIPIAPRQLAGDHQPKIAEKLRTIFNQTSYTQIFQRDIYLKRENLEALYAILKNAREDRHAIQMTKEDAQTLRAMLDDRLYSYFHTNSGQSSEERHHLNLLRTILGLLNAYGIAIPDETHEIYRHRHQLNFTVGEKKTIPYHFYILMEAIARLISRNADLYPAIRQNKYYKIDKENYHNTVKPRLAQQMSRYWRLRLRDPIKQKEFATFICHEELEAAAWMHDTKSFYQQASLIRGVLNILFPMNFKNIASVDFMASQKGNGEFARPADGNSHVVEQDSIQSPYEALMKTVLMLFTQGLRLNQFSRLLNILWRNAQREMKRLSIPYKKTKLYRKFGGKLPKKLLEHLETNSSLLKNAYQQLQFDPDVILLYIRYCIWRKIHYWKKCIQITSQDFSLLFHKQISCTGTPYNDGTYPAKMSVIRDPITIGELLHIVYQKCPENGIHILESSMPEQILNEILERFFSNQSKFSALIDGGAQLTGMGNEQVARTMMDFCLKNRQDIQAVKFYKDDCQTGKEQIYCFTRENPQSILSEWQHLNPKSCLTYFDQRHGFGANIPQTGDGLETIGPNHPLYRWLQELFRIRGLKKQPRLKINGDDQFETRLQNIHLCMTKEVQKLIMCISQNAENPPKPTLADIVNYAIRHEAYLAEAENYPAARRKIASIIKREIYRKMIRNPSFKQFDRWTKIWREFEHLFITEVEDDPAEIFGLIKQNISSKTALQITIDKALTVISTSSVFSQEEKMKLKEELEHLTLPIMPETVTAWKKNCDARSQLDVLDGLETAQTIASSQEQQAEEMSENEEDYENEKQKEMQNQQQIIPPSHPTSSFKYTEFNWPEKIDVASLQWLQFSSPEFESCPNKLCPFYKVRNLMEISEIESLKMSAKHFDNRLWMPNNFMPRKIWQKNDTSIDVGSCFQFKLRTVLVHFQMEENGFLKLLKMGPLSVKDTALWRMLLPPNKLYWEKQSIKTVLWDISTRTVVAGCPIDQNHLRIHSDMQLLIGQLKLLDGDVHLSFESEYVLQWLKQVNADEVQSAFETIHRNRGWQSFDNSIAEDIFIESTFDHPFEEDL